jgi:hypothetical protein
VAIALRTWPCATTDDWTHISIILRQGTVPLLHPHGCPAVEYGWRRADHAIPRRASGSARCHLRAEVAHVRHGHGTRTPVGLGLCVERVTGAGDESRARTAGSGRRLLLPAPVAGRQRPQSPARPTFPTVPSAGWSPGWRPAATWSCTAAAAGAGRRTPTRSSPAIALSTAPDRMTPLTNCPGGDTGDIPPLTQPCQGPLSQLRQPIHPGTIREPHPHARSASPGRPTMRRRRASARSTARWRAAASGGC